jgi:hypothetical protein
VDVSQVSVVGLLPRETLRALREREIRRFAELRPRGMALVERARASMPNGVPMTWMATLCDHPPIVVKEGAGAAFTDIDGNAYLDFTRTPACSQAMAWRPWPASPASASRRDRSSS